MRHLKRMEDSVVLLAGGGGGIARGVFLITGDTLFIQDGVEMKP